MTQTCRRCGERAMTIDNVLGTTFWGLIQHSERTTVETFIRVAGTWYRRNGGDQDRIMQSAEEIALCDACWSLLVGRFLQGREVVAREHEHEWRRGRQVDGIVIEQCSLCYQSRVGSLVEEEEL